MNYDINSNLREFVEVDPDKMLEFLRKKQANELIKLVPEIIAVGRQMNMNPLYILSHAILESGWGKSEIASKKNNLFGYGAYDDNPMDNAFTFPTKKNCLWYVMGKVAHRYLSPKGYGEQGRFWGGEASLAGMNKFYASDPKWGEKIAHLMNKIEETKLG